MKSVRQDLARRLPQGFDGADMLAELDALERDLSGAVDHIATVASQADPDFGRSLIESEEKFRAVVEQSSDCIFLVDIESRTILDANRAFRQLLGYSSEEVVNLTIYDFAGRDREALDRVIESILRDRHFARETRYRRKDGSLVDVEVRVNVIEWADREVFCAVGRDITERKRAEEELKRSRRRLLTILDSMPVAVMLTDRHHVVVRANRACLDALGYSRFQDLVGSRCCDTLCSRDPDTCGKADDWHELDQAERTARTRDGREIPILLSAVRIPYDDDEVLLRAFVDITDMKQAEEEKKAMQVQLVQSQKMEAVGTLAAGVAHDFNNLLTVMQGFTDLARLRAKDDKILVGNLGAIEEAVERASGLTNQLLVFSRRKPMAFKEVDLNASVDALQKMLRRLIGEQVVIRTNLAPHLPYVEADSGSIDQVVMNLVVNARDAMEEGGTIVIATEDLELDALPPDAPEKARPGFYVRLSVADTGKGIPEDILVNIFEPFFTTKDPGKGTGLGLSVVYGIVEEHGGWISVASTLGQGTTFSVYLPAMLDKSGRNRPSTEIRRPPQGLAEPILLVEDDDRVREFATMALVENGYQVYPARTAAEALRLLEAHGTAIRLALCDVVLPDQSGIEVADRMASAHPGLKVLLMSGYTDVRSHWPAIQDRELPFLQKPFGIRQLLATVRELLDKPK